MSMMRCKISQSFVLYDISFSRQLSDSFQGHVKEILKEKEKRKGNTMFQQFLCQMQTKHYH